MPETAFFGARMCAQLFAQQLCGLQVFLLAGDAKQEQQQLAIVDMIDIVFVGTIAFDACAAFLHKKIHAALYVFEIARHAGIDPDIFKKLFGKKRCAAFGATRVY
jgi:hypothetical protein